MKITINAAQQEAQDTFKAGSLVKSDRGVVLVTTKHNLIRNDLFSGVVMEHEDYSPGDWTDAWCKDSFVKFVGNITLEQ